MNPFSIALDSIWHNKTRSFLTALGVVIGVFAVVSLVALGNGMRSYIGHQFASFGADLIIIRPALAGTAGAKAGGVALRFGRRPGGGNPSGETSSTGTPSTLTPADAQAISGLANAHIVGVAPLANVAATVNRGSRAAPGTSVLGTSNSYFSMQRIHFSKGRFAASGANEITLGAAVAATLFPGINPLGQDVLLATTQGTQTFRVVGVLAKAGNLLSADPDHTVYLDIHDALALSGATTLAEILVRSTNTSNVGATSDKVTGMMNSRHPQKDFQIITSSQMLATIQTTLSGVTDVLGGIAAISLIVGGIGIMNIMLVTVTERFKEIGIRKALGARDSDILSQFLVEAMLLALVGGAIGLVFAAAASAVIARSFGIPAPVDLTTAFLALLFSAVVGGIFGVLPAWRAATLLPVEALRSE